MSSRLPGQSHRGNAASAGAGASANLSGYDEFVLGWLRRSRSSPYSARTAAYKKFYGNVYATFLLGLYEPPCVEEVRRQGGLILQSGAKESREGAPAPNQSRGPRPPDGDDGPFQGADGICEKSLAMFYEKLLACRKELGAADGADLMKSQLAGLLSKSICLVLRYRWRCWGGGINNNAKIIKSSSFLAGGPGGQPPSNKRNMKSNMTSTPYSNNNISNNNGINNNNTNSPSGITIISRNGNLAGDFAPQLEQDINNNSTLSIVTTANGRSSSVLVDDPPASPFSATATPHSSPIGSLRNLLKARNCDDLGAGDEEDEEGIQVPLLAATPSARKSSSVSNDGNASDRSKADAAGRGGAAPCTIYYTSVDSAEGGEQVIAGLEGALRELCAQERGLRLTLGGFPLQRSFELSRDPYRPYVAIMGDSSQGAERDEEDKAFSYYFIRQTIYHSQINNTTTNDTNNNNTNNSNIHHNNDSKRNFPLTPRTRSKSGSPQGTSRRERSTSSSDVIVTIYDEVTIERATGAVAAIVRTLVGSSATISQCIGHYGDII